MADLNSTTLTRLIGVTDKQIPLASVSGIAKDDLIVIDREAMAVLETPVTGRPVYVRRGAVGTVACGHQPAATVYSGTPNLFYSVDPVGTPMAFPLANPWINLRNGTVWVAQGDVVGPGALARRWQLQEKSYAAGALGILIPPTVTP